MALGSPDLDIGFHQSFGGLMKRAKSTTPINVYISGCISIHDVWIDYQGVIQVQSMIHQMESLIFQGVIISIWANHSGYQTRRLVTKKVVKSKGILPKSQINAVQLPQTCDTLGLHQLPSVKTQWPSKAWVKKTHPGWHQLMLLITYRKILLCKNGGCCCCDIYIYRLYRFLTLNMCLFRILFLVGDVHVSSPVK